MMIHYFSAIKAEKNEIKHRDGIETFDKGLDLSRTNVVEKIVLPDADGNYL